MKEQGPTAEEVERAKRQILKNRELSANDSNQVAIRLSEAIALGDWRFYFLDRDRTEAVTPEQVQEVAKKYLKASNRTVGLFLPSDTPQRTPVPARPDMAKMVDDYKGREVRSSGESFDASPSAHRGPRPASAADRGRESRPPAARRPTASSSTCSSRCDTGTPRT